MVTFSYCNCFTLCSFAGVFFMSSNRNQTCSTIFRLDGGCRFLLSVHAIHVFDQSYHEEVFNSSWNKMPVNHKVTRKAVLVSVNHEGSSYLMFKNLDLSGDLAEI